MKNEIQPEERMALINGLDQYGAALLHYITALDYSELISILYEHGADLNVQSKDQLTPLVIAAAKGHEKSVKKLIRLGAVFWNQSADDSFLSQQNKEGLLPEMLSSSDDDFSGSEYLDMDELSFENSKLQQNKSFARSQKSFVSINGGKSRDEEAIEIALKNNNFSIVELLLRDMTLKNAVREPSLERQDSDAPDSVSIISGVSSKRSQI